MILKDLSIIIPTLNEEEYLPALLESIFNQEYNYNFEVIIVDGHSDDKTLSNI
jgi:glycosyltransferase involved in cell wall biosynthesis